MHVEEGVHVAPPVRLAHRRWVAEPRQQRLVGAGDGRPAHATQRPGGRQAQATAARRREA